MCFRAHPHGVVTAAVRGMLNAETQNPWFQLRSTSIQAAVPLRNGQPQASVSRDHVLIHCTTRGESFRATEPSRGEERSRGNGEAVRVEIIKARPYSGLYRPFVLAFSGRVRWARAKVVLTAIPASCEVCTCTPRLSPPTTSVAAGPVAVGVSSSLATGGL